MKKIISILSIFLVLISCSDNTTDMLDPIIGKWVLVKSIEDNVDVTNDCLKRSHINFTEDFFINGEVFIQQNNQCTSDDGLYSGRWLKNESGSYNLTIGATIFLGIQITDNTIEFVEDSGTIKTTYKKQ
ncbi:hypothetical protein [uncultured Tenacibaculum sp.]|uniref:hypothetical protein n=1 Tax=uncultured Tenacibaculum sp. TaxID=174713 RepID=UPI00262BA028|nr:hypothetical protein [uncultured Tenacibaculum sp.]